MGAVKQEEAEDVYTATAAARHCYGSHDKKQERAMAMEAEEELMLIPGLPDDVAMECLARVPSTSHRRMRRVCRRWRGTVGSAEFRRRRRAAGASEHIVFLVQTAPPARGDGDGDGDGDGKGSSTPECALVAANLTTGEWRRVGWPAEAWGPVPLFAQCAAAGDDDGRHVVAVVGGWDPATLRPTCAVRLLDVPAGTWRPRGGARMPDSRSFFGCAGGGGDGTGEVYVAGGHDERKNALRSALAYSVAADAWRALPDMSEERDEPQLVATPAGRVLAASGYPTEAQGAFRSTAECCCAAAGDAWTDAGDVTPGGGGGDTCLASVRGTAWAVAAGKHGLREWDRDARAWRDVAAGPPGMKACVKAVGVGNGGGAVFVFGTAAEGEGEGEGVKYSAWVMEASGGGAWKRVPVPSEFGGFVYSAAAVSV